MLPFDDAHGIRGTRRRVYLYLDRETYETLRAMRARMGVSVSALLMDTIRRGLPETSRVYDRRLTDALATIAVLRHQNKELEEECQYLRRMAQPEARVVVGRPNQLLASLLAEACEWGEEKAEALLSLANRVRDPSVRRQYHSRAGTIMAEVEVLRRAARAANEPLQPQPQPQPQLQAKPKTRVARPAAHA
jgi:hypothetical protein